jgi:hypothetical protein
LRAAVLGVSRAIRRAFRLQVHPELHGDPKAVQSHLEQLCRLGFFARDDNDPLRCSYSFNHNIMQKAPRRAAPRRAAPQRALLRACHICTGTGPAAATSAQRLGSPLPLLHRHAAFAVRL